MSKHNVWTRDLPQCPRCKQNTIVRESDRRWSCLNCDFRRDFSEAEPINIVFLIALTFLIVLFVL